MSVREPWLIQRCSIKSRPAPKKTCGECLNFDYMGSSEFEWGVIPDTIRKLDEIKDTLKLFKFKGSKGEKFFILCQESQAEDYQKILQKLLDKEINTKEYVFSDFNDKIDFWMDLDNRVCFSTDRNMIEKFHHCVTATAEKNRIQRLLKEQASQLGLERKLSGVMPRMVALVAKDIQDCEGTKQLVEKTAYPFVFWLNGPHAKNWACGFFTVEQIEEYVEKRTGVIREVMEKSGNEAYITKL